MSIPDKRKSRSTTIFEGENETSQEHNSRSVTKLPTGILGVPLVDHDLPGDETFVVIARRFGKQIVYRFNKQKSLCLFSPRSSLRQFVIFLTTNQYFELFILVLIIINCILLAFKDQPEEVEYVFAALYTMEMILKIIGKGFCLHKFAYLRDPWNWLDFIVVILGYLTMAPSVANLSGIRTFRVLRALRTISVIEGLRTMVNAFLRSMRMLTDVLGLSLFFISIFALVGMQLFVGVLRNKCVLNPGVNVSDFDAFVANESNWLFVDDDPVVCGNGSTARSCPANYTCFSDIGDNPNHGYTSFDTFPWALLCTVQLVTADYWENVYEYIIASTGFWSVFYFLLVIFFGSFYILNLILAVVALSYQQEMANLKNKEADFHKLKTTSSSYSLHESFKAQKLFPTKPLNLSSIRRRSTKTSPYVGVSAAFPGPYHPSSPDDGNIAELSPLTLDKVTPYAFDNESVASFYNYEPSVMEEIRNGSKHNLDKDKDFRENEGICYDKKIDGSDTNGKEKMEEISISVEKQNIERILEKPHFDEPRSLDTRQKGKKRNANDTGVQIHAKKCVKSPYTKITAKGNLNSPNRSENNATNNLKEKSSQRNENMSTVTENPITYLTEKTKLSETASKSNENDRNEVYSRSIESPLQSKVTGESRTRQSVDHSEHFELDRIGDKHSGLNGTNSNSQFEKNSEYVLNKQSDHEDTNGIPRERSDMMIDIPKSVSKRTSCATTLAWEGSPRLKSIDRGLMIAQETGLMIVQTSSLCVVIPRETGQDHRLFNAIRRKCASFIVHPMFDWFITSVIFLNTIALAVEHHGMNRKFEKALDNINLTCTFVFILEMFLKVTALSLQGYIQSRWNILDGLIIVISVVELLIVWCVPDITHGLGFSVLRTFRLVRILKLAQSWVTMRALLSTIGASIGQLGNLTLLLAIVTYTFAVIGMQLFSGSFTPEHFEDRKVPRWNFGDFLHSFMIIFRVLCGEWIEPLVMTMHVTTPTSVVFYFAVLIIGNFLILNLFLALLLNSFSTESLNSGKRTRGSANIRERFRTLMKKYLNVMRAFRAPRVSAEHETKSERHTENEGGLRSDAVRECECEIARSGVEIDDNHHIPKKFSVSSRSEVVDETCSRTQSRDTWMTSSEHSPKPFVPDCFPKFCCMCFGEEKARRSLAFKAFVLSRGKVLSVVKHKYFDAFILFVILISSMSLALEDIHLDSKPDLKAFLKMFNLVVAVIFVLEFLLKLFAFGFVHYFRDAWNCLDFFIVVVSIVSLVGSAGDGNLTAFRSLRTLRALRPLRAIPRWKGMKVVVNSLLSAIPEIGNVSLVCSIFWLIFSVMGVQFFGGKFYKCLDEDGDILPHTTVPDKNSCLAMNYTWKNSDINFDNSIAGFLALFQVATFEGWIEVMADAADVTEVDQQPERDKNHIAHLYFVVFVLFGSFFVLNLFVGVIIDNFNRLKKEYESGAVGLFLTETQRAWYDTLKKAARKKPRKVTKRPKGKWRAYLFDIASSSRFEMTIMVLIIFNMVIMMVRHHRQSEPVTKILFYSNVIFTAIFCLEAFFRLLVQHLDYFKEPWNVFDFIVVLLSIAGLVMEHLNHSFIITPSIFRVVRVFRVGRLLRFYKNARGIRRLLFALLISLPALVNIGALLFLLLFIYAIIGMSSFAYVKHSGAINDMVNFETFRNSMLLLFRLSTSAGWNDVLAPLMVQPPECDPTHDDLPNGNCGNPYFAIFYFVTFVLSTSLIIINMYIAVIMENLHEAFKAEATGITNDHLDMFYHKWEHYDPQATQYIPHGQLSDFVDSLEEPIRLPKPNKFACINLHIPIQQGDRIHCVDVLQALVRQLLGDIQRENPDAFKLMQRKLEEAFLVAFPNRAKQRRETTTFVRNREIYAAVVIQKAWRRKVVKKRTSQQVIYDAIQSGK